MKHPRGGENATGRSSHEQLILAPMFLSKKGRQGTRQQGTLTINLSISLIKMRIQECVRVQPHLKGAVILGTIQVIHLNLSSVEIVCY